MKKLGFYAIAFVVSLWSIPGIASSARDFDVSAFQLAQSEGKVVLVDVYATWCPTCKAQQKDLQSILSDNKYKDVVSFKIDFDKKDVVKSFEKLIDKKIPRQSTIVILKGKDLLAFSVAEKGEKLKEHLDKGF